MHFGVGHRAVDAALTSSSHTTARANGHHAVRHRSLSAPVPIPPPLFSSRSSLELFRRDQSVDSTSVTFTSISGVLGAEHGKTVSAAARAVAAAGDGWAAVWRSNPTAQRLKTTHRMGLGWKKSLRS